MSAPSVTLCHRNISLSLPPPSPPSPPASQRLPGSYEVVFYSETEDVPGVMLWRYPEPRVLTFVRITPVPFNTTEDPEISTADLGDALQVGCPPAGLHPPRTCVSVRMSVSLSVCLSAHLQVLLNVCFI